VLPLICIDVDGTLVGSSHVPTDAVWHAAAEATARGQHLALSTARGAFGPTLDYARRLDPNGWHIFHNGGALIHTGSGEIRGTAVAEDVIVTANDIAERNGWVIEFYSADDYTVDSGADLAVEHAALVGVPHQVRTRDTLATEIVRVQFVVPLEVVPRVYTEMKGQEAVVVAATSPVMSGVAFVSCTKPGVGKGAAIMRIADEMQISVADVMMVGDGHNDVDALVTVGHGVAMANAVPEAKQAASYAVGHVDDDGLVDALALSTTLM
jgi:Cof subfamily protein (haloacid dehalogenase superfamily)